MVVLISETFANNSWTEDNSRYEFLISQQEKGPPEIDVSELQYDEEKDFLGEGTYGKVFKGRCRGQEVAIKVPVKQHLTKQELEEFRREVFMMSKIFHVRIQHKHY